MKENADWTKKLDGTEKNAVWCCVWEIDKREHWSYPVITPITNVLDNGVFESLSGITWQNAKPLPSDMVDFIREEFKSEK